MHHEGDKEGWLMLPLSSHLLKIVAMISVFTAVYMENVVPQILVPPIMKVLGLTQ